MEIIKVVTFRVLFLVYLQFVANTYLLSAKKKKTKNRKFDATFPTSRHLSGAVCLRERRTVILFFCTFPVQ